MKGEEEGWEGSYIIVIEDNIFLRIHNVVTRKEGREDKEMKSFARFGGREMRRVFFVDIIEDPKDD